MQELLAPEQCVFHNREWVSIGTRVERAKDIESITSIPEKVLVSGLTMALDEEVNYADTDKTVGYRLCVAQRMSWASTRQATRDEDKAYSLMVRIDLYGIENERGVSDISYHTCRVCLGSIWPFCTVRACRMLFIDYKLRFYKLLETTPFSRGLVQIQSASRKFRP